MYYLFKKDQFGNYIPRYAAQSGSEAFRFANNSSEQLYCIHVDGNKKTILGL